MPHESCARTFLAAMAIRRRAVVSVVASVAMGSLARVFIAAALAALLCAACGSRTAISGSAGSDDATINTTPDGGTDTLPPNCGSGACDSGESCTNCSVDCGLCKGCGNGSCDTGESCSSCPQDCGSCEACGDGFCKGSETCTTCAPDCGKCAACGDGTCGAGTEDCFTCPEDCGRCKGCGDGQCAAPETCASCVNDCGVCAVCGNAKCEEPYETCSNCHDDCGDCETIGCLAMLTCAFKCIDLSDTPPAIRVSCVADCVAIGCPAARFLFDQAFNCFIQHLGDCGGVGGGPGGGGPGGGGGGGGPGGGAFGCLSAQCSSEVAACVGATCDQ